MVLFNRVKSATVTEQEPGLLLVNALFIDTFHEISLKLTVNREQLTVVSAKAEMVRTPHQDCPLTAAEASALVGITIGPGARKAILKAVGHAQGCTHLADLALDAFKAVIQANFRLQKRELSNEERLAKFSEQLGGTCLHWSKVAQNS